MEEEVARAVGAPRAIALTDDGMRKLIKPRLEALSVAPVALLGQLAGRELASLFSLVQAIEVLFIGRLLSDDDDDAVSCPDLADKLPDGEHFAS